MLYNLGEHVIDFSPKHWRCFTESGSGSPVDAFAEQTTKMAKCPLLLARLRVLTFHRAAVILSSITV